MLSDLIWATASIKTVSVICESLSTSACRATSMAWSHSCSCRGKARLDRCSISRWLRTRCTGAQRTISRTVRSSHACSPHQLRVVDLLVAARLEWLVVQLRLFPAQVDVHLHLRQVLQQRLSVGLGRRLARTVVGRRCLLQTATHETVSTRSLPGLAGGRPRTSVRKTPTAL